MDTLTIYATDGSCTAALIPPQVTGLKLRRKNGVTTMTWTPVVPPGGLSIAYDVLAATGAEGFLSAECVEKDGGNTTAVDPVDPGPGQLRCYVVRAGNACFEGPAGEDSSGVAWSASGCP
jgi:hypothetical protein